MAKATAKKRTTIRSKQTFITAGRGRGPLAALFDVRAVNILLVGTAIALFVGYLGLTTQAASKGFVMRDIEKRITDLEQRKQKMDLDQVMKQSMDTIQAQVRQSGFVPVSGVEYLDAGNSAVAKN